MNIKKTTILCAALLGLSLTAKADYPLIYSKYTADPTGIEYNGRLYLFCSHDTYDPERGYGYYMNDVTCISTDDLKNWTDHGEVFSAEASRWGANMTWAPHVVERNGKFYLYYGNANAGGIGCAVSDRPEGPYVDDHEKPVVNLQTPGVVIKDEAGNDIKPRANLEGALGGSENWGMWCFDPCVIIDDDGQAYMYFGGAHPENSRVIKLKDNMVETDGKAEKPDTPGIFEASFVHKYKGRYYYSYSSHHFNVPANIDYVTSRKPMSGFSHPATAMRQPPVNDGFNHHHSIFTFRGEWYMAYHNRQLAYEKGEPDQRSREYMRSVGLDRLYYNADGSIQPVEATRNGLPQLKWVDPTQRNEAETMAKGWNIQTAKQGEHGNRIVTGCREGAYIKICGVDFQNKKASTFKALIANGCSRGGRVELRLEGPEGLLIGCADVPSTSGWNQWTTVETAVNVPSGIFDLYVVFKGNTDEFAHIDWWQFS